VLAAAAAAAGEDFWGAPDLDHTNPHLREALVHWMQHLRDNVGYRGWRFDFAKVCWKWVFVRKEGGVNLLSEREAASFSEKAGRNSAAVS
jgi:glycosidase